MFGPKEEFTMEKLLSGEGREGNEFDVVGFIAVTDVGFGAHAAGKAAAVCIGCQDREDTGSVDTSGRAAAACKG